MKTLIFVLLCLFFTSEQLMAYEARSVSEKIFAPDKMSSRQNIRYFDRAGKKKSMTLQSAHGGKELITDKKRSIVLIEDAKDLATLPRELVKKIEEVTSAKGFKKYYVFANFVHTSYPNTDETDFYIAIIPRSAQVERLIFQIEWFGGGVGAHTQLRMILNQPIILIPQISDAYPEYILEDGDLIYSLQAVRARKGEQQWDPLKGIMGEFSNALQFFSTEAKAKQQITRSVVENYEFTGMSAENKKAVFEAALKISNHQQEMGIYNTVFNSCVSHALLALKEGLPDINVSHFNPYSVLEHVKEASQGALQQQPSLNNEFSHLIAADILTMNDVKATSNYQLASPFFDLATQPTFDEILRKVALYVNDQRIRYSDIKEIMVMIEKGTLKPSSIQAKALVKKVQHLWQQEFPDRPVEDFFAALTALRSQN